MTEIQSSGINLTLESLKSVNLSAGGDKVANHKSAEKRHRQSKNRNARNTHIRSTMRSYVKKVRTAIAEGDLDTAQTFLNKAIPYIDKAASKGVIHKATASRKISRLTKLVLGTRDSQESS